MRAGKASPTTRIRCDTRRRGNAASAYPAVSSETGLCQRPASRVASGTSPLRAAALHFPGETYTRAYSPLATSCAAKRAKREGEIRVSCTPPCQVPVVSCERWNDSR